MWWGVIVTNGRDGLVVMSEVVESIDEHELDVFVWSVLVFFFFQAEDGIRDWSVTGVQTCALPICS